MKVVSRNPIDNLYRVMDKEDAPYGCCYSVGETVEEAIAGAEWLGIDLSNIEVI